MNNATVDKIQLKKLISSCDFLDDDFRHEWENKVDTVPPQVLQFVYKKFKDTKRKVETIYVSVALRHDPTGGKLTQETINLVKKFSDQ